MKAAQAKDVWRRVLSRKAGRLSLAKLAVKNVRGLKDLTIVFPTTFTVICGENGAGKTTLLKTLFVALAPSRALQQNIKLREINPSQPAEAVAEIVKRGDGAAAGAVVEMHDQPELELLLCPDGEIPRIDYVDAALRCQRIKFIIANDADFNSAVEGAPEAADVETLLGTRKLITGRTYDTFITFEIEDYDRETVFPYFKVTVGTATYGSEDMGQGELCANYLIWALHRLPENSILLLEEPEVHLPPRAQHALMNYVAQTAESKKLTVVVSTHSQHTMESIELKNVLLLSRHLLNFQSTNEPSRALLDESLRIINPKRNVLLTEDHSAGAFLTGILKEFDQRILDGSDVGWVQGYSDLDEISARFPTALKKTGLIAVYDGDQREADHTNSKVPFLFLPGTDDPVHYMVATVKSNVDRFVSYWPDRDGEIRAAIAHIYESAPKDFFHNLVRALGEEIELKAMYRRATEIWLGISENREAAKAFVLALKGKLII